MKSGKLIDRAMRLLEGDPNRSRITAAMIDRAIGDAATEFPPPATRETTGERRRRRHAIVGRAVDLIRARLTGWGRRPYFMVMKNVRWAMADTSLVGAGGKVYRRSSRSTSRSKSWAVYSLSDLLGVFTWTRPGGLSKRIAWHLIARRLEAEIPDIRRRLVIEAVAET